jgi:hypothetical protein
MNRIVEIERSGTKDFKRNTKKFNVKADFLKQNLNRLSCSRMFIAQGHVFGLNLSQESAINMCLKVSCSEDMGILRLLAE